MTLNLEVGKTYLNREGELRKITHVSRDQVPPRYVSNTGLTYLENGAHLPNQKTKWDLIVEVQITSSRTIDDLERRIAKLESQVPKPKKKVTKEIVSYVNLRKDGSIFTFYSTKEEALRHKGQDIICNGLELRGTYEVEE